MNDMDASDTNDFFPAARFRYHKKGKGMIETRPKTRYDRARAKHTDRNTHRTSASRPALALLARLYMALSFSRQSVAVLEKKGPSRVCATKGNHDGVVDPLWVCVCCMAPISQEPACLIQI